jgi:hypothetical protein
MTLYKYCRRCGKRLKGAENRIRGYGQTCYEKARQEAQGMTPLLSPTIEQTEKELKRLRAKEQSARAEAEEISRARARLQARAEQGARQSQEQSKKSKAKRQSKSEGKIFTENLQGEKGQKSSNEFLNQPKPPHLEKTLTPTPKKPLLFTPHTPTPTPK